MRMSLILRNIGRHINGWTIASMVGAAAILLPILYVLTGLIRPVTDKWVKVKQYLLTDYMLGSAKLVLYTGFFATLIGVVLAWLVVGYTFPLRRFFRWALVVPLAMPPYIAAFTYGTMTSYTGILQATLRNHLGIVVTPGTVEVMSMRGAVFILTLFLYPYVYTITRAYLERQSASYIENAMLLGRKRFSLFFRVVLPLSRPAIIAGLMLVVFEVLSDYGVANYFGVQTISTAIFQTWFGMYDVDSALRLAAWLMVAVIAIFAAERFVRRHRQFSATTSQGRTLQPRQLRGAAAWAATAVCGLTFLLAFMIPVAQLAAWSIKYRTAWRGGGQFTELLVNSLTGAAAATCMIIALALLSARTSRMLSSSYAYALSRVMTSGYAVPGAIVAIGVLAVFIALDNSLSGFHVRMGKEEGALVLSLSLAMLLAGYVIRFMATGYNAIEAGYEKIPRSYTEASMTLGRGRTVTFLKVELPMLRGAVLTGFILTFVEVVKELPLTLLLRPFNFDTLATRAYTYATDERIYEAALPSLLLIAVSLLSVLFILKLEKEKTR